MKILVTGAKGQLGSDVCKELTRRKIENIAADIGDFDITDPLSVNTYFEAHTPAAVIHCAAYTAVDKAEDEPDLCQKVNADGTKNIAAACKACGAKLMYISTDYVFSGEGETPHLTTDSTNPQSIYGKTKLAGETAVTAALEKHFIVRISWVFGKNGNNFVKTMLRLSGERETVSVVNDQIGSPTYTADLAPLLAEMIQTEKYGTYHATNEGECSWADFAKEIFALSDKKTEVIPIPASEYTAKAARPKNSRLSKESLDAAGFRRLPSWQNALARFISELHPPEKD